MRGAMRRCARSLVAVLALLPAGAGAEIYRWTDASGRIHFTEDLSRVPAQHRADAAGRARAPEASRVQTFAGPEPEAPAPPAAYSGSAGAAAEGLPVYRIRVQRAGPSMLVVARVNGSVEVPFLLDTGATDVLLPRSFAEKLGLEVGPETRTKRYATANGMVEHPVVMLDSVDLAGAVARDVPASIGPEMHFGLLGLSYFNRFNYHIDAAAGLVTLVPNGLEAAGQIRGGRSEAQWRSEFHGLRDRIARLEGDVARTPESHGREQRRLDEERAGLARQLALLDGEADRGRVPAAWRQ
jgi:aspartyl protease family protein